MSQQNAKIILGLKIRQLRERLGISPQDMHERTGISLSYFNEIEKGKKYPKGDKLAAIADALDTSVDYLTDTQLDAELSPVGDLLQSNFLNELQLPLFGIELQKVVEVIANSPTRVSAFISTLLALSRDYELREENFYFGALRSYLELNRNYFDDLEDAVDAFRRTHELPDDAQISVDRLRFLLETIYDYSVVPNGLDDYPELIGLRSVFVPKSRRLLLNSQLNRRQLRFQFGKELGFCALGLEERALTASLLRGRSFQKVLNHSRAIYFSTALLMPRVAVQTDLAAFFAQPTWNGEAFLQIMRRYDASPEMFYHRLTNLLPRYFGLERIYFLRFTHDLNADLFQIDRELHLTHRHHPHRNGLQEHYCRRWISIDLLEDLRRMQNKGQYAEAIVGAQISHYHGTDDEYLCLTIARPAYPAPDVNVSVTLGILLDEQSRSRIAFLKDESIQRKTVNQTCERCPITDCEVRAEHWYEVEKREARRKIHQTIKRLTEGE